MAMRGKLRDARWLCALVTVLVIVADRCSKLWIVKHVRLGGAITVIPRVFRITHVLNTGAAFSMGEGSASPVAVRNFLIVFSTVAVLVVLVLLWRWGVARPWAGALRLPEPVQRSTRCPRRSSGSRRWRAG